MGIHLINKEVDYFPLLSLPSGVQKTYIKPGDFEEQMITYKGKINTNECPETPLNSLDYKKRLRFEELKKTRLEAMCSWKKKDIKGIKKN